MLKINLLPAYIYERRKVRRAALGFGLLFVAVVFGMVGWWVMLNNKQKQLETDTIAMEQKAALVDALQSQIGAEGPKRATMEGRVNFIKAVMDYNVEAPKLYEEVAKYTYGRVRLLSITPGGSPVSQLTITGHARTLGDCGRYLMNLYRAKHIFQQGTISISGVPSGWPSGSSGSPAGVNMVSPMPSQPMPTPQGGGPGFDFTITATLVKPITAPTPPGGAGAQPAAAMNAGMAPGMMAPQPMPSTPVSPAPSGGAPVNP